MKIVSVCTADDMIHDICDIEKKCFSDPYSETLISKDVLNTNCQCYALCIENNVVGYYMCTTVLDEAELQRIAVDPDFRSLGIASLLMEHLIKQCVSQNISNIYLEVRESNIPARNLYEKYKFIQTGLRKNYYRDNGENAVLYTLSLNGGDMIC